MNFNLIPWDTESYLIAADFYEEQGFLVPKAIRDKVLCLDDENGEGWGFGEGFGSGLSLGSRGGSGYGGWINGQH